MNQLQHVSVAAPGFYGLNKQLSASELDEKWATEADNLIFDETGRPAARKGWEQLTTSAISGTPSVDQLFEYVNSAGTETIVSAAGSKLYVGTTALTDKTGSVTVTDDNWKFQNFNGNVIGYQAGHDPIIYTGSGNFTKLLLQHSAWQATTAYALKDAVRATSDNNLYFECTTAGTTGGSEPTWDTTVGNTTADGTAVWTTRQLQQSNECLAAFGRLWTTDGTVIHYSDLLIPWDNNGASGGSVDLKAVWVYGMDQVEAIREFNGFLVIFGQHNIVIYSGADDPTNMSLVEQINGIGCIARDSVQDIGGDLIFLSDTGVRSLQRTLQDGDMPLTDVSKNNHDFLVEIALAETKNLIRSVYHQPESFYLLNFPTTGTTFCFDTRQRLQDGTFRTTTWSKINPSSMCSSRDDTLYLGKDGVVAKYSGYLDNNDAYMASYFSTWIGQEDPRLKIPKKMRITVGRGYGYTLKLRVSFDYSEAYFSVDIDVPTENQAAEYNVSEYSVGEYSGGTEFDKISSPMAREGETFKFGWSVNISGTAISFQKVDFFYKMGRLSR